MVRDSHHALPAVDGKILKTCKSRPGAVSRPSGPADAPGSPRRTKEES